MWVLSYPAFGAAGITGRGEFTRLLEAGIARESARQVLSPARKRCAFVGARVRRAMCNHVDQRMIWQH
jgi:hypothetical protein